MLPRCSTRAGGIACIACARARGEFRDEFPRSPRLLRCECDCSDISGIDRDTHSPSEISWIVLPRPLTLACRDGICRLPGSALTPGPPSGAGGHVGGQLAAGKMVRSPSHSVAAAATATAVT